MLLIFKDWLQGNWGVYWSFLYLFEIYEETDELSFTEVEMVATPGFEPGTPSLWVMCSNQLSYVAFETQIII